MPEKARVQRPSVIPVQDHAAQVREALGEEIIAGVGGPGDVVELWGDEGAAKTRVALDLAEAIIDQPQWGPFKILRNGPVLFIESDMPEVAHGRITEEFDRAGYFQSRQLYTVPPGLPKALYHISYDLQIGSFPCDLPAEDLSAVIIDTWSSFFVFGGGASEAYLEGVIRTMIDQLRRDFPAALLIVINHTTTSGENGNRSVRALSPALSRAATTRYCVVPPADKGGRDENGRWLKAGALVGVGKFARAGVLPRKIALTWDWGGGRPAPTPDLAALSAGAWIHLYPHVVGLKRQEHRSQRAALLDLAQASGKSFAALKKAHQRDPSPALAAFADDDPAADADDGDTDDEPSPPQETTSIPAEVVTGKKRRKRVYSGKSG